MWNKNIRIDGKPAFSIKKKLFEKNITLISQLGLSVKEQFGLIGCY